MDEGIVVMDELVERLRDLSSRLRSAFGLTTASDAQITDVAAGRIELLTRAQDLPLDQRILVALGGLRDGMTPEDVKAVQRFVDTIRALNNADAGREG